MDLPQVCQRQTQSQHVGKQNGYDVTFFCTRVPEARTDRDTGVPRMDRESGLPLWQVQLAALDETGGEVLAVTMAGEPKVTVGSDVSLDSLVAIPWSQGDRSGVAYRAARISVASGSAPGAPATRFAGLLTSAANP